MNILISVLKMLGGLVLLIYGMKMLSTQLKKLSGGKLEKILISATNNKFIHWYDNDDEYGKFI